MYGLRCRKLPSNDRLFKQRELLRWKLLRNFRPLIRDWHLHRRTICNFWLRCVYYLHCRYLRNIHWLFKLHELPRWKLLRNNRPLVRGWHLRRR